MSGWLISLAMLAALAWVAQGYVLRAGAQNAEPPDDSRPVVIKSPDVSSQSGADTNEAETGPRRAPAPKLSSDESREFRESADNNASFPIDI